MGAMLNSSVLPEPKFTKSVAEICFNNIATESNRIRFVFFGCQITHLTTEKLFWFLFLTEKTQISSNFGSGSSLSHSVEMSRGSISNTATRWPNWDKLHHLVYTDTRKQCSHFMMQTSCSVTRLIELSLCSVNTYFLY